MVLDKRMSLSPLLDSQHGIHLSTYLVNRGSHLDLKNQIAQALATARQHLLPVLNPIEVHKFLQPLYQLLHEQKLLEG